MRDAEIHLLRVFAQVVEAEFDLRGAAAPDRGPCGQVAGEEDDVLALAVHLERMGGFFKTSQGCRSYRESPDRVKYIMLRIF